MSGEHEGSVTARLWTDTLDDNNDATIEHVGSVGVVQLHSSGGTRISVQMNADGAGRILFSWPDDGSVQITWPEDGSTWQDLLLTITRPSVETHNGAE